MDEQKNKKDEITSFNDEMITFDFDDLSIEELEQRLELAVGMIPMSPLGNCTSNNCGSFQGNCGSNACIIDN